MATNQLNLTNDYALRASAYDRGYQRGQQQNLNRLTGQAWNAPPEQRNALTGQIAAINPQVAQGVEQQYQAREKSLSESAINLAKAWKSSANASPEQRQAFYSNFMVPHAQKLGLPVPQNYDPAAFDQEADALIAMGSGGGSRNVSVAPGTAIVDPQTGHVVYERPYEAKPQNPVWDSARGMWITPPGGSTDEVTGSASDSTEAARLGKDFYDRMRSLGFNDQQALDASSVYLSNLPQSAPSTSASGPVGIPVAGVGPKPKDAPSGYEYLQDGTLSPIKGGPADRKANPTPADQAQGEMAMRKEVSDRLKQDRGVLSMFKSMQGAAQNNSAAGDLSLIFSYMKMLDPGSVVREQEFANAQNAAGVPDQIRNQWNRIRSGERLNPSQRADFLNQARLLAGAAGDRITSIAREYQGIADQYGYSASRATGMADFRDVGKASGSSAPPTDPDGVNDLLSKYGVK